MEQAHTQLIAQLNERISAADNTPLYMKFAQTVKNAVRSGILEHGNILPGEREVYLALAEVDHARALAAIEARMQGPGLKLGAVGSPAEGDSDQERPADVVLAEMAALLSAKDGIDIVTAQDRVLAEHPELKTRLFAAEQEVR